MSNRTIITVTSTINIDTTRKKPSENSHVSQAKVIPTNSPIKRVQMTIKVNVSSLKLIDFVPTRSCVRSIYFRLNPVRPAILPSPTNKIPRPYPQIESYQNAKLQEKINQSEPRLHIDLSYCSLIDRDIPIITNQAIINKKCTELWLYGNKITSEGVATLALGLTNNSTLTSLDLSHNFISDQGVRSLARALLPKENASIQILHLSKNGISDDGASYLAEMLQTNQTLTELWLSNNEIGNTGIKQLANVLAYRNKTLKCLSLSANIFITDISIDYLIEMFDRNRTLKKIWINACNLSEHGQMKLRERANQKQNFQLAL